MNAVINLNKAENLSSQQAVAEVKRLLAVKKAGHAGTLDPLATGILIVCLNEATKIARFLCDLDKEYVVRLKFGERTDTYDATGRIIERKDCIALREAHVREAIRIFLGKTKQVPPMYSAVKIGGTPLYKFARRGIDIERSGRDIQISQIEILSYQSPYLDFRVRCSKGTYIRTLCEDLGRELSVGAHMVSLTRTRVGGFCIEQSVTAANLETGRDAYLPVDSVLSHMEEVVLDTDLYLKARNGVPVRISDLSSLNAAKTLNSMSMNGYVRLKNPKGLLFGIGRVEDQVIRIERLLNNLF